MIPNTILRLQISGYYGHCEDQILQFKSASQIQNFPVRNNFLHIA
ncbi:unnamed protein product [Paramecium pentaurelia]|uniref:Uncharacterized protein n=1 Tax=Paramecium pentaurelia TaxID=43138 RepID=A0A8S1XUM9_9CILI|nr:unnamed protein product [Paramecium pentaurelia]